MDLVLTSVDEKVDYYLHKISVSANLTLHPCDLYEVPVLDTETYLIDQIMLEKGLLKIFKEERVISGKGLEIANFGGWLAYQKQLKKEPIPKVSRPEGDRRIIHEMEKLQKENAILRDEILAGKVKEATTVLVIKNLLSQNRNNTILLLLAGVAFGFILANLKSLLELF